MTKVEIELSTLRGWFNRLESNEVYEVTEEIFDAIKHYEKEIEDRKRLSEQELLKREAEKEKVLDSLEPSLTMKEVMINSHYRIKKTANFKSKFASILGGEVRVVSKGRTNLSVLIVEPGTNYTGLTLKTDIGSLTKL